MLLSLFLTGCIGTHGIAPQDHAVAANALATDAAIAQAAQDAHWPQSQWWRAYGDEQLNQWVAKAVQGSPTIAMAAARVRQAKAMAGVVESAESLQVTAHSTIERHDWPEDNFYGPGTLGNTTTWDDNATLGLSYSLDFWGRERNNTERALDMAHMTVAQARQAQLELENNVVRVYIQLSLQYAQRDIAQAMLGQQQQILQLAQKRLDGGIGTHFEVSEAETPLPETQRQIDSLDEEIALSANQLSALAGKGPGEGAHLQRPSLSLAADLKLPSAVPAQLLGQRPDVVASRWAVAAQARGIEVAQAGFYPDVDLSASLGYFTTAGGMLEFLKGSKFGYTAGPALSLPIFDGGRLRGQLGEASAGYDVAVEQYNQTLVNALKSVSDQLIRRRSMAKQADYAAQSVASARKTYDIATVAYKRGLTDYLNVLNAQSMLFRQQQIEQQVQASRLSVNAELITALGGGLHAGDDSPEAKTTQVPPTPASLKLMDRFKP
nr:efflux transporter outer membrane subunit [Pseudomonas sp. dw_358]